MTLLELVLGAAAITALARLVSLAVLPPTSGRLRATVDRLPAPLFHGLAAVSFVGEGSAPAGPVLIAAAAAVAVSPRRSLLLVVAAGLGVYALASAAENLVVRI